MFDPDLQPGQRLARGVARFLATMGAASITEYAPRRGLRADVAALTREGEIWIVECKSGPADFMSDAKWPGYVEWCDRFFFAVDEAFPTDLLPPHEGLMIADDFSAEIVRDARFSRLAPARRKAQTLRLARVAMERARHAADPGLAALVGSGAAEREDEPGGET